MWLNHLVLMSLKKILDSRKICQTTTNIHLLYSFFSQKEMNFNFTFEKTLIFFLVIFLDRSYGSNIVLLKPKSPETLYYWKWWVKDSFKHWKWSCVETYVCCGIFDNKAIGEHLRLWQQDIRWTKHWIVTKTFYL